MVVSTIASGFRTYGILLRNLAALTIVLTIPPTNWSYAAPAESHPGISLEPMYSEAVLAYNSKQPAQALKILDACLKMKSNYVQALELKALVLKTMGKPQESKKNYQALIKATPANKAAPYHFELGVIEYNAAKGDAAARHFEESAKYGFNSAASHFFLGLISFNASQKSGQLGEAEKHFGIVIQSDSDELKIAAHYYMGLIRYKYGSGSEGTFELMEARSLAKEMPENSIAIDITKAVDAALAPYSKGQWFGNASILAAYNGNISSLPNSASEGETTSGKKTAQTLLVAGIGRMSSPMSRLQWVLSYRGSYNINFNPDSSELQFLTHTGNLYLTLNPLARTQYGMKFEGNYIFSDQGGDPVDANNKRPFALKPYSMTGEVGPYMRREMRKGLQLSLEANYRPQKYYASFSGLTGTSYGARSSLAFDRSSVFWNPTFLLSYDRTNANADISRQWSIGGGLIDLMRLNDKNTLTAGLNYSLIKYPEGDSPRDDKLISIRLSWFYQLFAKVGFVADLSYQINTSSLPDLYSFTQPVISTGLSFNL